MLLSDGAENSDKLICKFCQPNALLTLQEYLCDYATNEAREIGETLIENEALKINEGRVKQEFQKKIECVKNGERDLYF